METKIAVLGADGQRDETGHSYHARGITFEPDKNGEVPVWLEAAGPEDHDIFHLIGKAKLSVLIGKAKLSVLIGKAKLSVHEDVLWADINVLDNKLSASLMKVLYPHPCGSIQKKNGNIIEEIAVNGVNLTIEPSPDQRVQTLDKQGVKWFGRADVI